jgi:hypothetical protein
MGNQSSTYNKLSFKDMQEFINSNKDVILLSTLKDSEQYCLISNTISCNNEVELINNCLNKKHNINIVLYGKNCNDSSVYIKYDQLLSLGFSKVYLYLGGLFEWMLLQDIYGSDSFPTTSDELDLLKFGPSCYFKKLLTY